MAALISSYLPYLPAYAQRKFSPVCSQQKAEQNEPYTIDATLSTLSTGKLAQVSVFTTGLLWANQQSFCPKLIEHLTASSLVIIEEAQQAADIRTAFSTSLTPAQTLIIYRGDDKQSPGGSENMNEIGALRKVLFDTPMGLRASHSYYQPWKLLQLLNQLIVSSRHVPAADITLHCHLVAHPAAAYLPYRPSGEQSSVNAVTHWLEPLMPKPRDARQRLDMSNPLGFVIAVMLDLGLLLSEVSTDMEAAGGSS